MTKGQLAKMGIHYYGFVDSYTVRDLSFYISLSKESTMTDIFKAIYEKGFEAGIVEGEARRISKIKEALQITD